MATEPTTYRAANDAYTGMLAISLIALCVGSGLLFYDYQQYPEANPKGPPKSAPPVVKVEPPPPVEKQPDEKEMKKDDEKKDEKKDDAKKDDMKKDDMK